MLTKEKRLEIVKKFGKNENDSGRTEVQVALLTENILALAPHFKSHIHDYHSNRGLLKMVGKRKAPLRYLQKQDESRYSALIKDLGLRK